MTKAAVPLVRTGNLELDRAIQALKQNMDAMTGQARNTTPMAPLSATATTADVIAKVNEIINRLQ